ncbi:VOC family protein [Streptomyces sp. t39]|uniref:VOC family protein n=1 Tax=Streptomyces sp. t39 TaxID=1828156 RepID=UPI0011CDB225|nr:VOC family protein [Streptomyces sp. t39]TXS44426.1 VOC family protein [Streptomyces sp. t39]
MTTPKLPVLVLDAAEPLELAEFYAGLLDGEARPGADPDLVEVHTADGVRLAVRRDHGHAPPSWPRPEDSLQSHLCIFVAESDMDAAEREAVSLGAMPVDSGGPGPRGARLFADPAGHSFSLEPSGRR